MTEFDDVDFELFEECQDKTKTCNGTLLIENLCSIL